MSHIEFWTIMSTWYAIANIFILAVAALYYIKQLKARVAALEASK